MSVLQLRFHGPYPLGTEGSDILADCPFRDAPGVYIWAVHQITGQYRVTYVGETTTSFYRRMKEHVIQTLGGNYRIIDPDLARQGIQQVVWDGLWRRGTRDQLPAFVRRYEELAPIIKRYLFSQVVFVAPLDGEGRLLRRVEGALAQQLRSDSKAFSLLPSDIRYVVRRKEKVAVPVTFTVEGGAQVEGLPMELAV